METIKAYAKRGPMAAFVLGVASGFPLTLLLATMTYWLAKQGIDKKTIGFAVGLTTPYTLKFLWAPFLDRLQVPVLTKLFGQRRSWLFVTQALLVVAIWNLGFSDPKHHLGLFAIWAIITAFLSATQDIIIDAYRIELLNDDQLAHGSAMSQFGYRTGNLLAGAGTVWLASNEGVSMGWALAYGLTGFLVIPSIIIALIVGPGVRAPVVGAPRGAGWFGETVIAPFVEFFQRPGAWLIIAFVLTYKLGDAMGQLMLNPMIVEMGYTDKAYIAVSKLVGFWALIAGSAMGPIVMARFGTVRSLFVSGVIMMLANVGFAGVALTQHSNTALGLAVGLENFFAGVSLTVFTTYLSGLSNLAFTATQFALLSSASAVGRTFLTAPSGYIAKALGWPGFYLFAVAVAVPGLICLAFLQRFKFVKDEARQVGGTAGDAVST